MEKMSDTEIKPTPAKKPEKKVEKVEKTAVKKPSNAFINTIVFFLLIASATGFYWLWKNQKNISIQQQAISHGINRQITLLNQQQQEASLQADKNVKNMQVFQEKLRKNLISIVSNNKYFRNDWLIAEAEYLIQLAIYRLLLEKDVTTAIVALNAADERLAEVADPALLQVRKVLKQHYVALKNIKVVDLVGLSVTITALSNNIDNLPLVTPDPKTHALTKSETTSPATEVTNLKQLPAAIWKDIKSLVIVRNHQKAVRPLLAPDQYFFLVQNLTLLFEQARLALLNGNNAIYVDRLQATKKWIEQYFDLEHNITRNMLASIQELQKFDISPSLPDISPTFTALRKYRTQGITLKVPEEKVKEK